MRKKILVTGGAGFIGSHLCKKLLEENNEVLCLDNYFTGSKMNILPLLDNPMFELIRHDIVNPYIAEVDEVRITKNRERRITWNNILLQE